MMFVFFLLFTFSVQADSTQAFVPVSGYVKPQYYNSIPAHRFYNNSLNSTVRDHKYDEHQKILKIDTAARTKYYTDTAYRKKVDAFNQLIFKCNSPSMFERILARYLILMYQFEGPHGFIVQNIKEELAQHYFDNAGKLINPSEIDHSLGAIVDGFFKNVFNHEMYLKAHNILHDDASLEIVSREKKGFVGRVCSTLSSAIKHVPAYLSNCFRSGCSVEQAVNNEYTKCIIKMIKLLQRGEFKQAKQLLLPSDHLMQELWWSRETICLQSGGTLPEKFQSTDEQKTLVSAKISEGEVPSFILKDAEKKVASAGTEIECTKVSEECLIARREALKESIESPQYSKDEYQFSHDVKKLLTEQRISPTLYRFCMGNQLQQVLHQEFLHLLTMFSKIKFVAGKLIDSKLLTSHFVSSVDLGREHNQLGLIKKAVLFANLSWGLLEHAIHQVYKTEDEFVMGTLEGSMQGVAHFFNMMLDPVGMINGFIEMAHSLGSIAEKIIIECEPREQHEEIWEKRREKIATISSALKDELSKMTMQDLARFGAAVATEMILFEKAMGTIGNLFKKGLQECASLAQKANEVSKGIKVVATTAEGLPEEVRVIKETGKQLTYAMESAGQKIKNGARIARKTVLPASSTLDQLPKHVVDLIKDAEKYFKNLLKLHEKEIIKNITVQIKKSGLIETLEAKNINCEWLKNIKIEGIDFKHGLIGDMKKGMPSGLHSTILCPEKIVEVVVQPGKRGSWVGKWFEEGAMGLKTSSFLPEGWNEKKMGEKIIESLKNISELQFDKNKLKIVGKTTEEIVVEFILNKNGKIESFYPLYYFKGIKCIP